MSSKLFSSFRGSRSGRPSDHWFFARRALIPAVVAFAAVSFLFTGCGKKEETYTPGTFNAVYNQTLKTACIECHRPGQSAYDVYGVRLNFSDATTAYQTLLSQTASGASTPGPCGGVKIVEAGFPSSSYIAGVLIASYNTNNFAGRSGCVPYSAHLQDQHLSADEQSSLINWIQNGAQNN